MSPTKPAAPSSDAHRAGGGFDNDIIAVRRTLVIQSPCIVAIHHDPASVYNIYSATAAAAAAAAVGADDERDGRLKMWWVGGWVGGWVRQHLASPPSDLRSPPAPFAHLARSPGGILGSHSASLCVLLTVQTFRQQ